MKKIIFVLIAIGLFQFWYKRAPDQSIAQPVAAKHESVILYATSWCGYCKKTRQLLSDNNVKYTEYDIETSEEGRKQHEQLGGNGVPVLDIKGTVIHGYDEDGIVSTLKGLQMM
jgi:glutaredoxin